MSNAFRRRLRPHAIWLTLALVATILTLAAPPSAARSSSPTVNAAAASPAAPVPLTRHQRIGADFNGDGVDDILWYAPGPAPDYLWLGSSGGFRSRAVRIDGTYTPVVGDFNGDGVDDILWYAPGPAPDYLWSGHSGGFRSRAVTINGTYTPIVGDFDGDGRDDIFWYAPGQSSVWFGRSGGGFRVRAQAINGSYTPIAGDFNGSGRTDIFWYRPGTSFVWQGRADQSFSSRAHTVGEYAAPVTGDFNGSGRTDIFWYAPGASSVWYGQPGGDFTARAQAIGGTYTPVTGDFTGDGRTDIVWYGPGAAPDYLWHSGTDRGFSSRALAIGGVYTPVTRGPVDAPATLTPVYAVAAGSVPLRLPSADTRYVGFHQAASRYAVDQAPRTMPVRWGVLPSRGRGTGMRTAADHVVPAGRPIVAPVSGVVVDAGGYSLYGRYYDEFVVIAPDTYGGEVHILHVTGLRVRRGDRVVGGATEIAAGARRFPFTSQIDEYSGYPTAPHVHIEVSSRRSVRDPLVYGG